MKFIETYEKDGSEYAIGADGEEHKVHVFYGHYVKGGEKPADRAKGGDRLCYTNWSRMTDEEKEEAESPVWIFNDFIQDWDPLC